MNYVESYQKQIQRSISRSQIEKTVGDLIILNTGIIVRGVKSRWEKGQSVNGGIIGTYRWDDYRQYKQALNPQAGGNVDLTLTGALSEGLTVKKVGNEYQIFSTDSKYQKLGRQYGFEEFGLTAEEAYEFFEDLYRFALEELLNELWK